jgi:hypothetical protein
MDMGGFNGHIQNMMHERRHDPTAWFSLPFPIQYQFLGAEAATMAPHQLMEQATNDLLNAADVNVEFYRGSMAANTAPAQLRLMESMWSPLVFTLNQFLQRLVNKISSVLSWDPITCSLEKPSHADNLERQMARLQLMQANQVSRASGLKSVGLDFEQETRQRMDEEKFLAEESRKTQEELDAAGLGEQMAAGSMPGAGGAPGGAQDPNAAAQGGQGQPAQGGQGGAAQVGGSPTGTSDPVAGVMALLPQSELQQISLTDLYGLSQQVAEQVYGLQSGQRISALRQIKQRNEAVHGLVKSRLEQLDQQASQQGKAVAQQAAQQASQQGRPM